MPNNLKARLKALPISSKLVLIGSSFYGISAFLPWYSDIDRFKIGDTFLGITGPLYVAGLIVLAMSALSVSFIASKLMGKRAPEMAIKESSMHAIASGMAALMFAISASVFFHSKFGLNLTDKTAGIGLIMGFMASGVSLLGAILMRKQKAVEFEEHLEPLIDISNERESAGVMEAPEVHNPVREQEIRQHSDIDRAQTIEEAMQSSRVEIPDPPTQAWSQVHESIQSMNSRRHSDTNDIL